MAVKKLKHDLIVIPIMVENEEYVPKKGYRTDATFDICTGEGKIIPAQGFARLKTGLRMAITKGFYGQLYLRSGYALKGLWCHPGLIYSDYRGEIQIILYNTTTRAIKIDRGERCCQILIKRVLPVKFYPTDFLPGSERGTKGFGSTDKKPKERKYKITTSIRFKPKEES